MSGKKRALGSDLAKVDAHVVKPGEYADAPEWTDAMFDRATLRIGGAVVRRGGRPKSVAPKAHVNLRLDPDVLSFYRSAGRGWQTRINAALRKAAGLRATRPQARAAK